MARDYRVNRVGVDSSGRAIFMTGWMEQVWDAILQDPRIASFKDKIVIVQGAWMSLNGGGASASAGYHDKAGCLDIRTWNLTWDQVLTFNRVVSEFGFPGWYRGPQARYGGMDPHYHMLLGSDRTLASGAANQWIQYKNGRNGLASNGPDYMWRPSPKVYEPTARQLEEDDMFSEEDRKLLRQIHRGLGTFRDNEAKRDQGSEERAKARHSATIAAIGGLADELNSIANDTSDDATRDQVRRARDRILQALTEDPAVDGPDNPVPADEAQPPE